MARLTIATAPAAVTAETPPAGTPVKRNRLVAWLIVLLGAMYFLFPLLATGYWSLRAEKDTLGFYVTGHPLTRPRPLVAHSHCW